MDNTAALKRFTILQGNTYQYRILRVIGSGSFGITYLAEMFDAEGNSTGMLAAVKELFMADFNVRQGNQVSVVSGPEVFNNYFGRFRAEAENLADLHHQNVVNVFECFIANGTIYYSMSYIDGGTLDEKITREGSIGENEALGYVRTLAGALGIIHSKGMLHLDIKPGNVMMLNGTIPVLIDFGLAKHFGADGAPAGTSITGLGTPGYAPIEQGSFTYSESGRIPYTLDIYALGASLFKMLTGRRPPQASEIFQEGFPEEELRDKNVSEAVIALIRLAMAPEYKARYQEMWQMISDIDDILACKATAETPSLLCSAVIPSVRFGAMPDSCVPEEEGAMAEVAAFVPAGGYSCESGTGHTYISNQDFMQTAVAYPDQSGTIQSVKQRRSRFWIAVAASAVILLTLGGIGYSAGLFQSGRAASVYEDGDDLRDDIIVEKAVAPAYDRPKQYTSPPVSVRHGKGKKQTSREPQDSAVYGRSWSGKVKTVTPNYNPDK